MDGEMPQNSNQDKNKLMISVVVVVLLVAVVFVLIKFSNRKKITPLSNPPKLEDTAQSGTLVKGFPGSLVLARGAIITKSEIYSNQNQPGQLLTTVYNTNFSMASLKELYINYAKNRDYQIIKSSVEKDNMRIVMRAYGVTTISIWDLGDKRQVSVIVSKNQ